MRKRYILLRAIWFWSFFRKSDNNSQVREPHEWIPSTHLSWIFFLQDSQQVTEVALTTVVTFVDITQKPEPPRGQPRIDWKLPFDFFFPLKIAFSRGVDSQKGSASLILILCLLVLGVLKLETKWNKKYLILVFPMGSSETAYLSWQNRPLPAHDQRRAFRITEDLTEGMCMKEGIFQKQYKYLCLGSLLRTVQTTKYT